MESIISHIKADSALFPVIRKVDTRIRFHIIAVPCTIARSDDILIVRIKTAIIAEIRSVAAVHIETEIIFRLLESRRPEHVELRIKLIAGTRTEVEFSRIIRRSRRLHGQEMRVEFVCTFVWTVEDRVVEVEVETHHGIRNGHNQRRLVDLHKFALIRTVDNDSRIKILSRRSRTRSKHRQSTYISVYHLHIHQFSLVLFRHHRFHLLDAHVDIIEHIVVDA